MVPRPIWPWAPILLFAAKICRVVENDLPHALVENTGARRKEPPDPDRDGDEAYHPGVRLDSCRAGPEGQREQEEKLAVYDNGELYYKNELLEFCHNYHSPKRSDELRYLLRCWGRGIAPETNNKH